jgi:alpha-tubulin suppressor-like RCC1 family protein
MPCNSRRRSALRYVAVIGVLTGVLAKGASADEAVVWTNLVGVSASGNSLTKTAATTAWDAGAASTNIIRDGDGYMEFTAGDTSQLIMVGLSNGDSGTNYDDVDYAFHTSGGSLYVFESGTNLGYVGPCSPGDRLRIEVRYGVVRYRRNGAVLRTSSKPPTYPLRVDAELYVQGVGIQNVRVGNTVWASEVGVSVAGTTLIKTGAAGWTSGAASANTIEAADGAMEFTATETNTTRAAGLSNGDTNQDIADIDFAVKLRDDATVEVTEGGASKGTFGSYVAGDRFRVEVRAGSVTYARNGSVFYTSTSAPAYPLQIDSALYTAGATLTDLTIESLVWTNVAGVTATSASLVKTAADGWNAGASSTQTIGAGDGFVEFKAIETNARRTAGLKSGSAAAQSYADIDYGIDLGAGGVVTIYENGVSRGQFGSYAHGDTFRVEISEGTVRYRKNAAVLYSSTVSPTYPLHAEATLYTSGATVAEVVMGDLVWMDDSEVGIFGTTLQKTSTPAAWTAGAASTRAINSGYVEFVASESNTSRMAGLSHGDMGVDYGDIDYAFYPANDGNLYIYEAGVYRGYFGGYAPGDRLRVALGSGVVNYYRNGTLLRTSPVAPTLPLRADTSLAHAGATLLGVTLVGAAVTDTLEAPAFSPAAGTYYSPQSVAILAMGGSTIRYTTDGTDPTTSSPVYSVPIAVSQSLTLKAKAVKAGYSDSAIGTAAYVLKVVTPTLSVGSGTYSAAFTVTVSCSTSGAVLHYTTNGVDPTEADPTVASGGTVAVAANMTLTVRGWKTGWTTSDPASAAYTLRVATPTINPIGGSYGASQAVMLSTTTSGATISYTLDGREPTAADASIASGGSVLVAHSAVLKARAYKAGWTPSDTAGGTYDVSLGTVAAPALAPGAGTYTTPQSVVITSATAQAEIRFTTDGSEPNAFSRLYRSPVAVAANTTVKARAFKEEWIPSAVTSAAYTLNLSVVATPSLVPGTGRFSTQQAVTVSVDSAGATIHYTTSGLDPTAGDPTVTSGGTVLVDRSLILKVRAWKTGVPTSGVGRADYVITGATAAGRKHSLALKADGTVWAWGTNGNGELGDGSTTTRPAAVQVSGVSSVIAIAAGWNHSLAVKADGTVWTWGYNGNGQLGNGTATSSTTPVQVSGLSGVVAVAAGPYHSLALKADGTIWAWGDNGTGELGNGTQTGSLTPVQVTGITTAKGIAAGDHSSLAVLADGTVRAWGMNSSGQLGDGTTSDRYTPVTVNGLRGVTAVAAGSISSHALRTDGRVVGSVWSWGSNYYGVLGDGTNYNSAVPVATLRNAYALAVGLNHVLAATRDGSVWAWGTNDSGHLGDGTTTARRRPVRVSGLSDVAQLAAGESHSLALRADGVEWSWGANSDGQLDKGSIAFGVIYPTAAATAFSLVQNASLLADPDGDGLITWREYLWGSDPLNADTNGNGLLDGVEVGLGMSPGVQDSDGDGVPDAVELAQGTDPFRADTDGDGVPDGADCFPLDPTRWQCLVPDPNDHTPPTITLLEPPGAVPVP